MSLIHRRSQCHCPGCRPAPSWGGDLPAGVKAITRVEDTLAARMGDMTREASDIPKTAYPGECDPAWAEPRVLRAHLWRLALECNGQPFQYARVVAPVTTRWRAEMDPDTTSVSLEREVYLFTVKRIVFPAAGREWPVLVDNLGRCVGPPPTLVKWH